MAWEFDFNNGIATVGDKKYDLYQIKGELYFRPATHLAVRLVANTGNDSFDRAVNKAWTDYCFERDVLK